ncbi:Carbohydrate-binding cytochrome b562, partial [Balamuthia mandrillaris]
AAVFRVELPLQQTLDKAKKQVVHWADATIIASGLRNEVGIDFDAEGRLWGVENGVDRLVRSDMGDIHNDNPAEEVNLIWSPPSPNQEDNNENTFFGYPYCWSEGKLAPLKGEGEGTQWAHPEFLHDGIHTDEWCRNESNVVPPQYWLPAHLAPLDILFYHHQAEGEAGGRKVGSRAPDPSVPMAKRLLPTEWEGDAFVSTHGSWNRMRRLTAQKQKQKREITEGRNVLRLHFEDGKPVENSLFFSYGGPPRKIWGHKLVGLALGPCADQKECLFIASDSTNVIFAVGRADL